MKIPHCTVVREKALNFFSSNDDGRTAHGRLMLVGGEHVCDVDGNMGSRDSSS